MLLRLGAQRLAQELLEQEVTDFLGRARYERIKAVFVAPQLQADGLPEG